MFLQNATQIESFRSCLTHPLGEIASGGVNNQVIMVVHQTVCVAESVKAVDDLPQALQEDMAIRIVLDDILPGVASGRHIIDRSV